MGHGLVIYFIAVDTMVVKKIAKTIRLGLFVDDIDEP